MVNRVHKLPPISISVNRQVAGKDYYVIDSSVNSSYQLFEDHYLLCGYHSLLSFYYQLCVS